MRLLLLKQIGPVSARSTALPQSGKGRRLLALWSLDGLDAAPGRRYTVRYQCVGRSEPFLDLLCLNVNKRIYNTINGGMTEMSGSITIVMAVRIGMPDLFMQRFPLDFVGYYCSVVEQVVRMANKVCKAFLWAR